MKYFVALIPISFIIMNLNSLSKQCLDKQLAYLIAYSNKQVANGISLINYLFTSCAISKFECLSCSLLY